MPLIIALIVMLWYGEMQAASKPVIMRWPTAATRSRCNDLVFYWERG